jgi:SagB-type dehydrogenase family enzyme
MVNTRQLLTLRRDVTLDRRHDAYVLTAPRFTLPLPNLAPGMEAALRALLDGGSTEEQIIDTVVEHDGVLGGPYVLRLLQTLDQTGLLCRTLMRDGVRIATMVPVAARATRRPETIPDGAAAALSRFAFLRREGESFVLESPRSPFRIVFHDPQLRFDDRDLAQWLREANMLADSDDEAELWEFHDLLFHSRTRLGRYDAPYGGTFRHADRAHEFPATRPAHIGEWIELPHAGISGDAPLSIVMEARRSIREQGERPITLKQLSEFFHRVARVKSIMSTPHGDVSSRPWPSGGALHPLELYPVVDRCGGLEAGLYHYDPLAHGLTRLTERTAVVERILDASWRTMNQQSKPQVVILIAARFGRVAVKYESVRYALLLKDTGVLMQSMYLVATAMNLAPCALGGGDSDLFAAASGLDYFTEGTVGEFVIGSRGEAH